MFKDILVALGLRKAQQSFLRRYGLRLAPFGGLIPTIAYLAWRNRDQLKSAYGRYVQPRLHRRNVDALPAAAEGIAAAI